jgi:hypothetical protein
MLGLSTKAGRIPTYRVREVRRRYDKDILSYLELIQLCEDSIHHLSISSELG